MKNDVFVKAVAQLLVHETSGMARKRTDEIVTSCILFFARRGKSGLLTQLLASVERESARASRHSQIHIDRTVTNEKSDEQLEKAFKKCVGEESDVTLHLNRKLMGGFVATITDTRIDASLSSRVRRFRESLTSATR